MDLRIHPSNLRGTINVPPSKSITHRHLICAALSKGKSIINNPLICDDTMATIDVLKTLGAKFKIEKDRIIVKGNGKPKIIDREITVIESASTLRMLLPVLVFFSKTLKIHASKRLIDRIYTSDLMDLPGLSFQRSKYTLTVSGKITDLDIVLSGKITTQLISGVLFVMPYLDHRTTLSLVGTTFKNPYVELTIEAITAFGVRFEISEKQIKLLEKAKYEKKSTFIEGDFSHGAVWLVASYFHHDLEVSGLDMDSIQGDKKIVEYFNTMGVHFNYEDKTFSYKSGIIIPAIVDIFETPDLGPILATLAAKSQATVIIKGTSKLTFKESNRKLAMADVINKIGGFVRVTEDEITIHGRNFIRGDVVDSYNDHRVVMAVTILATIANNPVVIKNFNVVTKSYPKFFEDFENVGGKLEVI